MINKIVVSVVAGISLLGTTLVAAQCPPNLNAEEIISCIVAEGAGAEYIPVAKMMEVQMQSEPAAESSDEAAVEDNNALATAQLSH